MFLTRHSSDACARGGNSATGAFLLSSCAVFFLALAAYAATAQRGVSWQDSGIFQHRLLTGTFIDLGGGGLAVVHPWYLACGRLFCLCFPEAWRVYAANAFSGFGAAVALTLLSILVRRLTGRWTAALAAVVTLGFAHMVWWLATIAEVYTWSLAFLFAEVLCVLRVCKSAPGVDRRVAWYILLAVNGMHASLHNVAFLNLPAYAALWLAQVRAGVPDPRRKILFSCTCAVCWLAGATLLLVMVARDLGQTHSVAATVKSLLVGTAYGGTVLGTGGLKVRLALGNLALAAMSLASPCWALALRARGKTPVGGPEKSVAFLRTLLGLTAVHLLFWIRYFVPDQATFVLPTLGLGAVWLGLGAAQCGRKTVLAALAAGVACQVLVPPLLASAVKNRVTRTRFLPFRDEERYWLVPWKHTEHSAQRFAEAADGQLKRGDVLIGDLTALNPVVAARAAGELSGEGRLVSEWSGETDDEATAIAEEIFARGGRVFAVSPVAGYVPEAVLNMFEFERDGVLWRVVKHRTSLKGK